jgi:hypothetical protein
MLDYTRLDWLACDETLKLSGPISNLQRKWRVVNTEPGSVFTALLFLRSLKVSIKS